MSCRPSCEDGSPHGTHRPATPPPVLRQNRSAPPPWSQHRPLRSASPPIRPDRRTEQCREDSAALAPIPTSDGLTVPVRLAGHASSSTEFIPLTFLIDPLTGPLAGVKVIELGNAIAAPLCGSMLGYMGADVVKIEPPGRGDYSRSWGDQVLAESPYFLQYNRNKRSVAVDLKSRAGKDVLAKLIKRSDVLVENFRPGTMSKLGFSESRIRTLNPSLIHCAVSGFGQTGPYSQLGGYDSMIQAMSGVMAVTGEPDGDPLRVGAPITDIVAALAAAFSVASALYERRRSRKGQVIDVSLFESGLSIVAQWVTIATLTGRQFRRFGNVYPLLAPYELFKTADSELVLAIGNDVLWSRLCSVLGLEEQATDPRFKTNPDRIRPENRRALTAALRSKLLEQRTAEWIRTFWKEGIPAA